MAEDFLREWQWWIGGGVVTGVVLVMRVWVVKARTHIAWLAEFQRRFERAKAEYNFNHSGDRKPRTGKRRKQTSEHRRKTRLHKQITRRIQKESRKRNRGG